MMGVGSHAHHDGRNPRAVPMALRNPAYNYISLGKGQHLLVCENRWRMRADKLHRGVAVAVRCTAGCVREVLVSGICKWLP